MFRVIAVFMLLSSLSFAKPVRLKDLISVKGVRDNPIVGYGIVIGLNGTGDGSGEIIDHSLKRMFTQLGLNPQKETASKNVASVIVTAKLPSFGRLGQKIDVTVSSIGNASSLSGGTLLITPLKAGDGDIYAIASGSLSVGGLERGKRFPTTATISSGATIEKEVGIDFDQKTSIRLSLHNPDFTTSARLEKTINEQLGGRYAISRDAATVDLMVPVHYRRNVVQLMAVVENFTVNTDTKTKIVINERTGTIVAGGDITVKPVAVSHGDLTIEVGKRGGGAEQSGSVYYMDSRVTLNDLVKSLNALGATPEDLMAIFQAIKKNGALVGELEIL